MPLLDFNSLVICNEDFNLASLNDTLTYFREYGITNFIISCGVNLRDQPPHYIRLTLERAKQTVSKLKVRSAKILFVPHIHFHQATAYDYFTPQLKARKSNLIFLQMPLLPEARWVNPELNYLLYKLKLRPVFVNYESAIYDDKYTLAANIFRSPNIDFCFDINYIIAEKYEFQIHQAMTYGSTIIPCISNELEYYGNVTERFLEFRKRVGDLAYLKICRHINCSCKSLWNRL